MVKSFTPAETPSRVWFRGGRGGCLSGAGGHLSMASPDATLL
jgi:hypothetical protein